MSIQVNDFQWEPGKNDAEYIKLLESSRNEWQKIAQKAIAKLKTLSNAQEPRLLGVDELKEGDVVWLESDDHKDVNVVEVAVIEKYDGYLSVDFSESFAHFESAIPPGDDYEDYGVSWRCWTARPTDEQREAIPWRSI